MLRVVVTLKVLAQHLWRVVGQPASLGSVMARARSPNLEPMALRGRCRGNMHRFLTRDLDDLV